MDKKVFIIILCVVVLFTLNFSFAQETDNSTTVNDDSELLWINNNESVIEKGSSLINTHIDVEGSTDFDVVGDSFKIKLSDADNNIIPNKKISFTVNGITYAKNMDSKGIVSLKINLANGTYCIAAKFSGDSKYKQSSKTATITVKNTVIVEKGLTNTQIQKNH